MLCVHVQVDARKLFVKAARYENIFSRFVERSSYSFPCTGVSVYPDACQWKTVQVMDFYIFYVFCIGLAAYLAY